MGNRQHILYKLLSIRWLIRNVIIQRYFIPADDVLYGPDNEIRTVFGIVHPPRDYAYRQSNPVLIGCVNLILYAVYVAFSGLLWDTFRFDRGPFFHGAFGLVQ